MASHHSGSNGKSSTTHRQRQPARTPWLWLLPLVTVLPYLFAKLHYHLPAPQPPLDANGHPQPSEEIVRGHIQELESCGYRTVGTEEAVLGEQYIQRQAQLIKDRCDKDGILDCELWIQRGSGYHMFSIMDHDVLKLYAGITNIILKISAKNPPSGKAAGNDSVLLGAHIDSTLPSPGAADDGIGCGVMLDVARILVDRKEPFDNSIVFMWNGGEETLQDGSHLYSTQHPTRDNVRAVINLEAAGTTGGALLFQATSHEMIEAFEYCPYPRGTVIAADVFSSGIIMSDTDFGQFEKYLEVTGLDMAIVGHSYFYHTRKDILENIEVGSAQHFTSNIMAIVDYLLSPSSPLHSDKPFSPPDIVYMSLYDRIFLHWTMKNANIAYVAIATIGATLLLSNISRSKLKAFAISILGAPLGIVAGIVSANAVAALMIFIDVKLAWYSHEGLCCALYLPAAALGQLATQYALGSALSPTERVGYEKAQYFSQMLLLIVSMLLLQALRIRSAYLFAGLTCVVLVGIISSEIYLLIRGKRSARMPFYTAYFVPVALLVGLAMEAFTTVLDIFVPLAGRMGKEAPSEIIVATITAACGLVMFPLTVPLFARAPRKGQRGVLVTLLFSVIAIIGLFAGPWWFPFDPMHPKRLGAQYMYNHTSGEHSAHLAFMDAHNGANIATQFHDHFGLGSELEHTVLTDYDSDWDTLYPVSTFLDTYRFPLPNVEFEWPVPTAEFTRNVAEDGNTHIHMRMTHTGLVWPTLAFEADLVDWSYDFEPPHGRRRHHIKAATSIDEDVLELELTLKLEPDEKLKIFYSGIDLNQMVPGTALTRGPDMPASKWLLAVDEWAMDNYGGSLEIVLSGIVTGILEA